MRSKLGRAVSVFLVVVLAGCAGQTESPCERNPSASASVATPLPSGANGPIPIAVPDFVSGGGTEAELGHKIAHTVVADLQRSGVFAATQPCSQSGITQAQADAVMGKVALLPEGRLHVEFRHWDLASQKLTAGAAFTAPALGWRRVAHLLSDMVYRRYTHEPSYFDSQIAYVSAGGDNPQTLLAIMDQDGEYNRYLIRGQVSSPHFNPNAHEISYIGRRGGSTTIAVLTVANGQSEELVIARAILSQRLSPDGAKVVFAESSNGTSDIYEFDRRTRETHRLTSETGSNASPSYRPDGRQMVFSSDRSGSAQLYVMAADGSGVQRISSGDGTYGNPEWSPRGDWIAFTKIAKDGRSALGLMHPDGSGEQMLAEGSVGGRLSWSPNGATVLFCRQSTPGNGLGLAARLYAVDTRVTGDHNERLVPTPGPACDASWSPNLP